MAKAENKAGTMRPRYVEIQPSEETMTNSGTNVTVVGTIRVKTVRPRIAFEARPLNRARA